MLTTLKRLLNNNPLRSMSETDRKVLAICIGAAFIFWLILNLSRPYTIRQTVNINYLLDPERTLARDSPVLTSQDVTINGPGWDLLWESLRWNDIQLDIDLRGLNSLELKPSDLESSIKRKLSSGDLNVSNLDFVRQTIFTAPKEGKVVPVVSRINTVFSPGFVATEPPVFTPDSIIVTGPGDLLSDLREWPTEQLTLDEVESDLNVQVSLAPPSNSLTPSRTMVRMSQMVEAFIQRTIEVPVTVINAPSRGTYQVVPEAISLVVTLPQSSYYAIRPDDFSVVADLSQLSNFAGKNNVALSLGRHPKAAISAYMTTRAVEFYRIN